MQQQQPSHYNQGYNVPMYVNPYGMRRLSPLFQMGPYDVICARGKVAYNHEGNRRFRELVKSHQKQYSACNCKYEKSKIVSLIVATVRKSSPYGGFVKNIDGAWYEVGDRHAKEKVGQTFRDLLHTKYSSSTKAKARARMQRRNQDDDTGSNQKSQTRPETVPSGTSPSSDSPRSSVSVVSSGSVEVDMQSDATTIVQSNTLPPLRSVTVKKEDDGRYTHPGQAFLPQVSPSASNRSRRSRSLEAVQPFPLAPTSSISSDLEPLPLKASVKVDFNESSNTIQSEESFEDAMSEFCEKMGVAV